MVAARETKEDTNMATIGNFTVNGNGFVGTVKTLALGTVKAKIVAAERTSEKAPEPMKASSQGSAEAPGSPQWKS